MRSEIERLAFGRTTRQPLPWAIPRPTTTFLGRLLLALVFLASGLAKLTDWSNSVAYMQANGIVRGAGVLLFLAALVELLGALSLITGTLARIGALLLFLFLIPTTLLFHDFWNFTGVERQMQMVNFLKNVAIMGGLLVVVGFGAGQVSVDRRIRQKRMLPA